MCCSVVQSIVINYENSNVSELTEDDDNEDADDEIYLENIL